MSKLAIGEEEMENESVSEILITQPQQINHDDTFNTRMQRLNEEQKAEENTKTTSKKRRTPRNKKSPNSNWQILPENQVNTSEKSSFSDKTHPPPADFTERQTPMEKLKLSSQRKRHSPVVLRKEKESRPRYNDPNEEEYENGEETPIQL